MLDALLTVVVIVAAVLVIWRQVVPGGPSSAQGAPRVEDASGTLSAELTATSRGSGPVALIEVADFQCPFCGRHAREVEPAIRKAFVETGLVREVFINYPLPNHALAARASEAAICAGSQGQFWEMRDALFQNQTALELADLTDRVRELGLDVSRFSDCLSSDQARRALERDMEVARTLGVRATPTFFIGVVQMDDSVVLTKRVNGALPLSELHAAINDVLPSELQKQVRDLARLLVSPWSRTITTGGV
jgi:protein-disulfide isomerase